MSDSDLSTSSGNRYPVPDPTTLTTQQLHREVLWVREMLETRLNGVDKAIALVRSQVEKPPSIAEIYAELKEKLNSVQLQFRERDVRSEQTQKDGNAAVAAALQAAKEAVGEQNKSSALAISKNEAASTKQIDLIGGNIRALESTFNDKIGDVKDRLNNLQVPITNSISNSQGRSKGLGDAMGYLIGVAGVLAAIAALFVRLR